MQVCVSAFESYLRKLNGATFRAEPDQSQIGTNDRALTMWLRCLSVTYGMTSSSAYYYTNGMTNLFVNTPSSSGVTFQSIGSMADFWTVSFPHFSHGSDFSATKCFFLFINIFFFSFPSKLRCSQNFKELYDSFNRTCILVPELKWKHLKNNYKNWLFLKYNMFFPALPHHLKWPNSDVCVTACFISFPTCLRFYQYC